MVNSDHELGLLNKIDEIYTENLVFGTRRMVKELFGYNL